MKPIIVILAMLGAFLALMTVGIVVRHNEGPPDRLVLDALILGADLLYLAVVWCVYDTNRRML